MTSTERLSSDEDVAGCLQTFCCYCCSCKKKKPAAQISGGDNIENYINNSAASIMCDRTTDRATLLAFMYTRFREKRSSYKYSSTLYRRLDTFCFFIPLMLLQCGVAIIYAIGSKSEEMQRLFSGIASAVSALIIAIQNRLKFGEASKQYQNGARSYSLLAAETFTKWLSVTALTELRFQAFIADVGQLEKEIQDTCPVPPDWVTTKFEKHVLVMKALPHQHDPSGGVVNNADNGAPSARPSPGRRPPQLMSNSTSQVNNNAPLTIAMEEGVDGVGGGDGLLGRGGNGFMGAAGARLRLMQGAREQQLQRENSTAPNSPNNSRKIIKNNDEDEEDFV